jgi:hypothetical protein
MVGRGHMQNVAFDKGPKALAHCDIWPKHRAHLLGDGYDYQFVTVMIKCHFTVCESLLKFHYPTLYEDDRVLFCDTGDHLVVYIATPLEPGRESKIDGPKSPV